MVKETKKKLRLDKDGEPYAICPKCHRRIYYVEEEHTIKNRLYPSNENNIEWEPEDDYDDTEANYQFLCPKCHKVIAQDEDEVLDLFLE
jgi:predicted HNH restriction endonuclease